VRSPPHLLPENLTLQTSKLIMSLILLPFRIIAFVIRVVLWTIAIPLIILIRVLEIVAPEVMRPLRSAITATIGIFKF
jgi:hypothetical protein